MKIYVESKRINEGLYALPLCDKSKEFCKAINQTCFTREQVKLLELNGYEIINQSEEILRRKYEYESSCN